MTAAFKVSLVTAKMAPRTSSDLGIASVVGLATFKAIRWFATESWGAFVQLRGGLNFLLEEALVKK